MKRFLLLLIIPIISIFLFSGCNETKYTISDVQSGFTQLKTTYSNYFINVESPNTVVVTYSNSALNTKLNETSPITTLDKRYYAFKNIEQKFLNQIFNYYENWQEDFYTKISSVDVEQNDLNNFYNNFSNFSSQLANFNSAKNLFEQELELVENDTSQVLTSSVTKLTYSYNTLISSGYNFMFSFVDLQNKYIYPSNTALSSSTINRSIDNISLKVSYVAFLENIQVFNKTIQSHGVCDLAQIVDEYLGGVNDYVLLDYVATINPHLSNTNVSNLNSNEESMVEKASDYLFEYNLFNQNYNLYLSLLTKVDMGVMATYKYGLIDGKDENDYIQLLTPVVVSNWNYINNFLTNSIPSIQTIYNLF